MILNITPDEATVLHIILERIAGCETTSGRQHADSLRHKLEAAGEVYDTEKEVLFPVNENHSVIMFIGRATCECRPRVAGTRPLRRR